MRGVRVSDRPRRNPQAAVVLTDFGDPSLRPLADVGGRRGIVLTSSKPKTTPIQPSTPAAETRGSGEVPEAHAPALDDPSTVERMLDAGFVRVGSVWRR